MATVYLGIGTNLGNREENLKGAVAMLEKRGVKVLVQSSFHETEPWGVVDQPMFLNAALKAETTLSPPALLSELKDIERRMGRFFDSSHWGPRVIDLDILFYDSEVINTPALSVPHKLLSERDFVLAPLAEIAPDLIDPLSGKTILKLRGELKENNAPGS